MIKMQGLVDSNLCYILHVDEHKHEHKLLRNTLLFQPLKQTTSEVSLNKA